MAKLKIIDKNNTTKQEINLLDIQLTNPSLKIQDKYIPLINYDDSPQVLKVNYDNKEYGIGLPKCTITINQMPNELITLVINGVKYTSTFSVDYGTPFEMYIIADEGYATGDTSIVGIADEDIDTSTYETDGIIRGIIKNDFVISITEAVEVHSTYVAEIIPDKKYILFDDSCLGEDLTGDVLVGGTELVGYTVQCPQNDMIFKFGLDTSKIRTCPAESGMQGVSISGWMGFALINADGNGMWMYQVECNVPYTGEDLPELYVRVHFSNPNDMRFAAYIHTPVFSGTYVVPYMTWNSSYQSQTPAGTVEL